MTSSGTNNFNPSSAEIVSFAFSLCGIRRAEFTQQHLTDARMALNLLFSTWGNDTPNLWTVDLVTTTLVEGTATYDVDPDTIMILDAYIRTGTGEEANDRIIWPVSRTEYASYPNKALEAPPTSFWFDRLLAPTITMWPVPDEQTDGGILIFYRCTSIQDADMANGQTADIPPRWLMAAAFNLAEVLAISYAPDRLANIAPRAKSFLTDALEQDTENVPLVIAPGVGDYYRR